MISTCSAIVAITGNSVPGSNSLDDAPSSPASLRAVFDDHALQAEAEPEGGDGVLAREAQGAELALDAANAESAGDADGVEVGEVASGALLRLAVVGRDPVDLHLRLVGEAPRT